MVNDVGDSICDLRPRCSAPSKPPGSDCTAESPSRSASCPHPPPPASSSSARDLDNFPIPASWRHVARVSYATSLMRQGVLISTTEHLLSVFYSMGIDNAYIEIDNLEVPILDGSGLPFVKLHRGGRHPPVPPQAPLPAHPPADLGGGQGQAHQHSARRVASASPATPTIPHPGGPPVARTGSHARALRRARSPSPARSAGNTSSTRCATWG